MQGQTRLRATLEQVDVVHRMMRKYSDTFELAFTADDVERIFKAGRIAWLIGMEGGQLNQRLDRDAADVSRARRPVHDADAPAPTFRRRVGHRHGEGGRLVEVRRRSDPR